MAMTREQMDEWDRIVAGQPARQPVAPPVAYTPPMDPMDPMLRPEGTAGGPVRSYSLDDIRRFLGFGNRPAMSPAEVSDAAQMYERLPNPALPPTPPGGYDAPSPSIPYMPSTDPRGAAAPIPPPPLPVGSRPSAPVRRQAPIMRGLPTNEADFTPPRINTLGGVSPADMAAMGQTAPAPIARPMPADPIGIPRPAIPSGTMVPGTLPGEAATVPLRATPQQLAQAIRRFGRMELDPDSFAARYARTQR